MFQEIQQLSNFCFQEEEFPFSNRQFEFENQDLFFKFESSRTNELASPTLKCPFKEDNLFEDDAESYLCFKPKSISTTGGSNRSSISLEDSSESGGLLDSKKVSPESVKFDFGSSVSGLTKKNNVRKRNVLKSLQPTLRETLSKRKARLNLKHLFIKRKQLFQDYESSEEETDNEEVYFKSIRSEIANDSDNLLSTFEDSESVFNPMEKKRSKESTHLFDNFKNFNSTKFLAVSKKEDLRRQNSLYYLSQTLVSQKDASINKKCISSLALANLTSKVLSSRASESAMALSSFARVITEIRDQF